MNATTAQAYSDLPYPGQCVPEMHPNRLAVIATLFGLQPAHPNRCRVLELGCGSGGSLIPFAHTLPASAFLGIDITPSAIAAAQSSAKKLGMSNVEFRCADILQLPGDIGIFDYIVAHGVYSWVPAEVREKMLHLCRAHLAPHGVAYISYNARPGSDLRRMLRDIMLFHAAQAETPLERVQQGRAVTEFLAEAKAGNEMYTRVMEWNRERIARMNDALFFHDDLAAINEPFFFYEFVRQAAAHDLQYLGEADFFLMTERRFEPHLRQQLEKLGGNLLTSEQYMDFLSGRAFRQTLVCHQAAPVSRNVTADRVSTMFFASAFEPVSPAPRVATDDPEEFSVSKERTISTAHPLAKAMLVELHKAYPGCLTFRELCDRVRPHLDPLEDDEVAGGIIESYASGPAIELFIEPPPCAVTVRERPRLAPIARMQLEAAATVLTNLRCHLIDGSHPLVRPMLALLDGSRDRAALLDALVAAVQSGAAPEPPNEPGKALPLRDRIAAGLDHNLRLATRLSLFTV